MTLADQQPGSSLYDFRHQFDVLHAASLVVSFPVVVCTTRFGTWGSRYLGLGAVLGFFWPLLFAAFYGPAPGLRAVFAFWQLTFVLLLVHRVVGVVRRRRGYRCHSQYWGTSRFDRGTGRAGMQRARVLDSVAAVLAGILLHAAGSKPLAALLFVAAAAKLFAEAVEFQAVEARLRQAEDARLENEYYLDLARTRRAE